MTATLDQVAADPQQPIAELQRQLDERTAERDAALAREAAVAEVLQVINSSPGDLAPVFDAMLDKATRLCEAAFGILLTYDGERFRHAALRGIPAAYGEFMREHPPIYGPGSAPGRLLLGERLVHVVDMMDTDLYRSAEPNRRAIADLAGARTVVAVPLRKDNAMLGAIIVFRQEVRAFSEKQLALLESFAAQAVIAMENARLITETREALEQQTATAEVLGVINSSPGDLAPVFDAMLEKAVRLCEASHGHLWRYDGEYFHPATAYGEPQFVRWFEQRGPVRPQPHGDGFLGRIARGERLLYIADVRETEAYRAGDLQVKALVELSDGRSVITIALRKEDKLVGAMTVYRQEVRPFTDKQIALLQNFGAQAVIAMENARLITETREALEQQTATAEVLQVINLSPGDLAPVFDAMLERAVQLCKAQTGHLMRYENGEFNRAASVGGLEDFDMIMPRHQPLVGIVTRDSVPFRTLATRAAVHVLDMLEDESYRAGAPAEVAGVQTGIRTALFVPLLREGEVIGNFVMHRREKRPFTDKQIALVQNFAAQAVIAIENARLITETREALEQQTATAEVLGVINSSPGDLAPVFDAILEKAHALCGAPQGSLQIYDGEQFRAVATRGLAEPFAAILRQGVRPSVNDHSMLNPDRVIQIADVTEVVAHLAPDDPSRISAELSGTRTVLFVPLHKDNIFLGRIVAGRQEVRPFTDKQIALLENFAAQAVIAMENARLITETREALEQQTATAEVLQVINSSPGDLAPVFDAMLERAMRLCGGVTGILWTFDGERARLAASRGLPAEFAAMLRERGEAGTHPLLQRLRHGEHLIQVDLPEHELYRSGDAIGRAALDAGVRSVIWVGLVKDGTAVGAFVVGRLERRRFSDKQIALLQNFAAQAVIAMENARLITETREALEQQTATAEVLEVINNSPGELQPVFDAVLVNASRLCDCVLGGMFLYENEGFRSVAMLNVTLEFAEIWRREANQPAPTTALARLADTKQAVRIDDLMGYEGYTGGEPLHVATVDVFGARTVLAVPMLKESELLGAIVLFRQQPHSFTEKQLALVSSFASQAAIAIENARLITETREALEQQTATAEVLGVINSNPGDLQPVFDAMLEKAMRLCGAAFGELRTYDGENFLQVASRGVPTAYAAYYSGRRGRYGPGTGPARLLDGELIVHIPDLVATEPYQRGDPDRRALVDLGSARASLLVPLLTDRTVRGFIMIYRQDPGPFTDKQIALLQNFAAQAVVAMENARLILETREARDDAEAALGNLKFAQANLIQAEKMASLGQLTAGIAHEIKNPLNFVNNFAGLSVELLDELKESTAPALDTLSGEQRADVDETMELLTGNLEKIAEHGRRADNIVKSMLEHSRGVSGEHRAVDLNGLLDEALNLAYHGARAQDQGFNIALEHDYAPALRPIELAPQEITRVFLNLFGNGFYAANKRVREGGDGAFRPTLRVATRDLGDTVEVRVRDNGAGISPDIRDKLFQPFFTTKPTGEGTGLGLSISYDIVTQQHGGTITVDSEVGAFTEFTIRLPRDPQAAGEGGTA